MIGLSDPFHGHFFLFFQLLVMQNADRTALDNMTSLSGVCREALDDQRVQLQLAVIHCESVISQLLQWTVAATLSRQLREINSDQIKGCY